MSYTLNLQDYQRDKLFQIIPDFKTFLLVKLYAMKCFLSFWNGNKTVQPPYLLVDDSELHRIFLINQDGKNVISFSFEFVVKPLYPDLSSPLNSIEYLKNYKKYGTYYLQHISEAIGILNEYAFLEDTRSNRLYFDERIYNGMHFNDDIETKSLLLFEQLAFSEPCYIRYDNTTLGYIPDIHPKQHFDIHFTKPYSYKFGLPNHLEIRNIQDNTSVNFYRKIKS